jgi:hypothetical protein
MNRLKIYLRTALRQEIKISVISAIRTARSGNKESSLFTGRVRPMWGTTGLTVEP